MDQHAAMTRIEYTAYYPLQLLPDTEWVYYGPTDRHTAEGLVRYVNKRAEEAGIEHRAVLMERAVTVGEWKPANTGIVPPFLRDTDDESRRGGITG